MSLTCELSGEPIASTKEPVVATPSGHICIKRLLLQKLTENGGMDPFETIRERPLSEDQLIELKTALEPPPRPQVTSFPNLLQMMQTEYDALVLELFDTRKALEDTRRELSQALYQNDAAVRVVARLSMERDAARQELEQWNASVAADPTTATAKVETSAAPAETEEPQSKRRKVERPDGPLTNDLPEEDYNTMLETWEKLHPNRKPLLKAAAVQAPSPEALGAFTKKATKNWHKSSCRSVIAMARDGDLLVTAGKDMQVVVYSVDEEVVKHTFSIGSVPTCVSVFGDVLAVGATNGKILAYSVADGSTLGELTVKADIVDIEVHPTGKHLCAAASDGRVMIGLLEDGKLSLVSTFQGEESVEYTCGALHPDGLLYAAGTKIGAIHMWDFKNKVLASTLKEGGEDAVTSITFSANGYHLATGHQSAAVKFWDLRKQKVIATMNEDASVLSSVASISFDDSAKFAAIGGEGGLIITTVKEWGTTCRIATNKPVSGLEWTKVGIASTSDKERAISFHGSP